MGVRVFISYAGADRAQAKRIARHLTAIGHEVFFDSDRTRGGDLVASVLFREIKTCDAFVLVATPNIVARPYVEAEVECAFSSRKRIIVVRRADYLGSAEIDFRTRAAVWINTNGALSQKGLQALTKGIDQATGSKKIVVATLNLKGGTGKTTLCGNLFAALSEVRPQPVLMVDLDPQHNLTQLLLRTSRADRARDADRSVLSLFEPSQIFDPVQESPARSLEINTEEAGNVSWQDLIEQPQLPNGPSVGLVVGQFEAAKYALSRDGAGIDHALRRFSHSVEQLSEMFPIIAIDVNPSASAFTEAALSVATHIVAPIMPNIHSYVGVKLLCQYLRLRNQQALISRIIPVLMGFPSNPSASEIELIEAVRDDPDFGARTLPLGIHFSRYLIPRNDDPQGLGYLRNARVGENVRAVASLLLSEIQKDDFNEKADDGPIPHQSVG